MFRPHFNDADARQVRLHENIDVVASPRRVAICVFRNSGRILVGRGFDPVSGELFFRPLGGGIEPGESAEDAVRREVREELCLEIQHLRQLGVIDNRFEYGGRAGHEHVAVFDASFDDPRIYDLSSVLFCEQGRDGGAEWIRLSEPPSRPLFPAGLADLLASGQPMR